MATYLIESTDEDLEDTLKGSGREVRAVEICMYCGVVFVPGMLTNHKHTDQL